MTEYCPDCGLTTDPDNGADMCECDDGQDAQDWYRELDWADGVTR